MYKKFAEIYNCYVSKTIIFTNINHVYKHFFYNGCFYNNSVIYFILIHYNYNAYDKQAINIYIGKIEINKE